jgi:hypothetical protein
MSYNRRILELTYYELCDEKTIHCETEHEEMRCEVCGKIQDQG